MKIRTAATFLMISSIFWIIYTLYNLVMRVSVMLEFGSRKGAILDLVFSVLFLMVPISLLLLAIALLRNEKEKGEVVSNPKSSHEEVTFGGAGAAGRPQHTPSVGNWVSNFLITAIPVAGLVVMIIWANDSKDIIRKNWAVASLIWAGILFGLLMFIYLLAFLTAATNGYY